MTSIATVQNAKVLSWETKQVILDSWMDLLKSQNSDLDKLTQIWTQSAKTGYHSTASIKKASELKLSAALAHKQGEALLQFATHYLKLGSDTTADASANAKLVKTISVANCGQEYFKSIMNNSSLPTNRGAFCHSLGKESLKILVPTVAASLLIAGFIRNSHISESRGQLANISIIGLNVAFLAIGCFCKLPGLILDKPAEKKMIAMRTLFQKSLS